jgi:predicted transcriptional regulator of viral defense system
MKIQRISQDIYLSNQSILKKREVYVTYSTNVNIDNVVDAIGVLKVSCKLIFYNLKKKGTLEMILQQE